jgi:hypothetical protein
MRATRDKGDSANQHFHAGSITPGS